MPFGARLTFFGLQVGGLGGPNWRFGWPFGVYVGSCGAQMGVWEKRASFFHRKKALPLLSTKDPLSFIDKRLSLNFISFIDKRPLSFINKRVSLFHRQKTIPLSSSFIATTFFSSTKDLPSNDNLFHSFFDKTLQSVYPQKSFFSWPRLSAINFRSKE